MRVLVFCEYYRPEPILKPVELAEALAANGHEVTVITGLPHYPQGKLAPGYRLGLLQRETINHIPVVRTFEYPYHGLSSLGRMANYLSFMLSAPLGAFVTPKCDVMYVRHPPLTIGVAAWLIGKIKRIPIVYDVQDIWPDFVVLSGMMRENGIAVRLLKKLEKFVYRRATHLIVLTEAGRENLISKGVPPEKVSVLPNWADEDVFSSTESGADEERVNLRRKFNWENKFIVLFAGNLGIVQGLDTVIEAAKKLSNGKVQIVFVGDGVEQPRLEELTKQYNLDGRIQFVERQPLARMPAMMAAADALLVHLKRSELVRYVVPSKTMAYLAGGKPILMAMNGAAAELVEEARAGIVVEPENPDQLAAAIERMQQMSETELAELGANGKRFWQQNLSKRRVIARYEDLLRAVAEKFQQNH